MSDADAPVDPFVPGGRLHLEGASSGPLVGCRFAVKDLFDVAGCVTGGGNPDWLRTHGPAPRHAPVVAACLAAGATRPNMSDMTVRRPVIVLAKHKICGFSGP